MWKLTDSLCWVNRLGITVTVTRGSPLSLRRGVGVYTAFSRQFWLHRSLESVQQRYSRLGRCGLCLLEHTTWALIWAVQESDVAILVLVVWAIYYRHVMCPDMSEHGHARRTVLTRLNYYVSVLRLPIMLEIVLMLIAAYCALNCAGIMCACLQNSRVVEIVDIVPL